MHDTKVLPDRLKLFSSLSLSLQFFIISFLPHSLSFISSVLCTARSSSSLTVFPLSFKSSCLPLIVVVLFYFIIIVISNFSRGLHFSVSCVKRSFYSCSIAYLWLIPRNTGRGISANSLSVQSVSMILIFRFIKVQRKSLSQTLLNFFKLYICLFYSNLSL